MVSKVKRADQLAQGSRIQGVPSLAIEGKYLVLNEGVGSNEALLARTDKIIEKARSERNKKK